MKSLRLFLLYILFGKEVRTMAGVYATLIIKGQADPGGSGGRDVTPLRMRAGYSGPPALFPLRAWGIEKTLALAMAAGRLDVSS